MEKEYIAGCKKDPTSVELRVESVESYEQGRNEQSFLGAVTDQERSFGFVQFYDLEIDGHPSYFADGVPVHNCHKLTNDAQTAILKLLEDPPRAVYFVLCTTDPAKLIKTIQTRCTAIKLDLLSDDAIRKLIESTCAKHKAKLALAVIERIVTCAEGSARKALVLLEQVWGLEDKEQLACIDKSAADQEMGILLARALIKPKPNWAEVAGILKQSKDEPESVRYLILGYARTVLLGGGPLARRAYTMIDCFSRNFYDSKQAGLAAACWEVVHSE